MNWVTCSKGIKRMINNNTLQRISLTEVRLLIHVRYLLVVNNCLNNQTQLSQWNVKTEWDSCCIYMGPMFPRKLFNLCNNNNDLFCKAQTSYIKNKAQHTVQDSDINYTHIETPQAENDNTIDYKQLTYGILLVVRKKSLIKPQVWFDVCACSTECMLCMFDLYTLLPPFMPFSKAVRDFKESAL